MERKYKVNDSAAGDSSANGAQSKEVALEKLRKMEWKRNTQDPWHLARSNSKGDGVQERKKYNKDEDNYFEGTGVQKTKKLRRPRTSEGSPSVPPGFCAIQSPPAPPQVNAWAQKKGSALFQREDDIDEEDQVMKLVLEESLRSVEEDNRRRLERLKMTNLDIQPSSQTVRAKKNWEGEYGKEDFHVKHNQNDTQEAKTDLHFVETDVKEENPSANQRHRFIPPRSRKLSPREKSKSPSANTQFDYPESSSKVSSSAVNNITRFSGGTKASPQVFDDDDQEEEDNDNFFEPSRPQGKSSKPVDKVNESNSSLSSYVTHSHSSKTNNTSAKHANINSDDLATSFNTTLTLGDTQGLHGKIQEHNESEATGNTQNLRNETPFYTAATDNNLGEKPGNPSEPSETDILLHSFIRHDPPPNTNILAQSSLPDMYAAKQIEENDFLPLPPSPTYSFQNLNLVQGYLPHQIISTEQNPVVNGVVDNASGGLQMSNGRDSSSSISGSPLQNSTPFGSLEKELPSIARTGVQPPTLIGNVPFQYPYLVENQESLTRHLQAAQLMNQNLPSTMNKEYSSVPSPVRGMIAVNPHGGQPQYRLPNSNIIIPSFQGYNMSPLLLQQHLQQAHLRQIQIPPGYLTQTMALDAARLQQSQLPTSVAESDSNTSGDQANINQSQIQNPNNLLSHAQTQALSQTPQSHISSQAQAQILSQVQAQMLSQNQPHLLHLQNHPQIMAMQHQQQSVETVPPKQEELLQQQVLPGSRAQPAGKSTEELHMEYINALQTLRRVQEQMEGARVQPALPQVAQTQPQWGVPGMSLATNQFFPVGMMPQVHPQLIQQVQNAGLTSPTIQQTPETLPGSNSIGREMHLGSELDTAQEPTQTAVGRGRGRLH